MCVCFLSIHKHTKIPCHLLKGHLNMSRRIKTTSQCSSYNLFFPATFFFCSGWNCFSNYDQTSFFATWGEITTADHCVRVTSKCFLPLSGEDGTFPQHFRRFPSGLYSVFTVSLQEKKELQCLILTGNDKTCFRVEQLDSYWMDCHEIWHKHLTPPVDEM